MHFAWTCQAICPRRYCTCTAKGLKPLILIKDEEKEMDTLFEAQLKKMISNSREKNRNYQWQEWVNSVISTSVTLEV